MNTPAHEHRETFAFYLASVSATMASLSIFAILTAQAYIRWSINKDFVVIGGFELEVLTFSTFLLILGILFLYRPQKSSN